MCGFCNFLNCQFRDNVYFKNNEFHWASFQNARFYSNAYFDDSVFKDFADFNKCEFREIANFYGVTFEKTPSFKDPKIALIVSGIAIIIIFFTI